MRRQQTDGEMRFSKRKHFFLFTKRSDLVELALHLTLYSRFYYTM